MARRAAVDLDACCHCSDSLVISAPRLRADTPIRSRKRALHQQADTRSV